MKRIALVVNAEHDGQRLDRFLADARPDISRVEAQQDVREGRVSVSGDVTTRPAHRVREDDEIVWETHARAPLTPRPIPLQILYEDDHIVVVDKPTGLVVHPGAGTDAATLVEGLLHDRALPPTDDPVRPGIVHRLDKETSGVIVVAKTPDALTQLQRQFAARTVEKLYLAAAVGTLREEEGTIDAPVGRDPAHPRRMSVHPRGRAARTDFQVLRRLDGATLLLVRPRTGRTHQIRVHFDYIGHPVLGDSIYGSSVPRGSAQSGMDRRSGIAAAKERPGDTIDGPRRPREQNPETYDKQGGSASADGRTRLMLHAWRLSVDHPATAERMTFEAPVPPEFPDFAYDGIPRTDRDAT